MPVTFLKAKRKIKPIGKIVLTNRIQGLFWIHRLRLFLKKLNVKKSLHISNARRTLHWIFQVFIYFIFMLLNFTHCVIITRFIFIFMYYQCFIPCIIYVLSHVLSIFYPMYYQCFIPCIIYILSHVLSMFYPMYYLCFIPCFIP